MNGGGGGYRRGGGNRGGGSGGSRHYSPGGRSQRSTGQWVVRSPAGAGAHLDDALSGSGSSEVGSRNLETASVHGVTKKFNMLSSYNPNEPNSEPLDSFDVSPNDGNYKVVQNVPGNILSTCSDNYFPSSSPNSEPNVRTNMVDQSRNQDVENRSPSCIDNYFPLLSPNSEPNVRTNMIDQSRNQDVENRSPSCINSTPLKTVVQDVENRSPSCISSTPLQTVGAQFSQEVQSGNTASEEASGKSKLDSPDSQHNGFSFDICRERDSNVKVLKTPLHLKNKALRMEKRRAQEDNIRIYGPGMILLKGHLSLTNQVRLVKSCRDLGRGPGGFYPPGYRDGAKLHLKMMCLGKNWDPETCSYGDKRPIDQAKPPPIPDEFQQLVKEAIQKCHCYLELDKKMTAKNILPPMSPNICIMNFYMQTGKLGLHQDKDESQESLRKRLPVVSFSVGDTAEFLFGDSGDVNKADKVDLESGDVLIFGGESRHIFHGVSKIAAGTAPKALLDETNLLPGRLNLTFREY